MQNLTLEAIEDPDEFAKQVQHYRKFGAKEAAPMQESPLEHAKRVRYQKALQQAREWGQV